MRAKDKKNLEDLANILPTDKLKITLLGTVSNIVKSTSAPCSNVLLSKKEVLNWIKKEAEIDIEDLEQKIQEYRKTPQ